MRASETALEKLHNQIATSLTRELEKYANGEYLNKEGEPLPTPASLISTAAKYLNDNSINRPEQDEVEDSDLLADELPIFGED